VRQPVRQPGWVRQHHNPNWPASPSTWKSNSCPRRHARGNRRTGTAGLPAPSSSTTATGPGGSKKMGC